MLTYKCYLEKNYNNPVTQNAIYDHPLAFVGKPFCVRDFIYIIMEEKYLDLLFESAHEEWQTEYMAKRFMLKQFLNTLEEHSNFYNSTPVDINKNNIIFIIDDYYINYDCIKYDSKILSIFFYGKTSDSLWIRYKEKLYINSLCLKASIGININFEKQYKNINNNQKTYIMHDKSTDLYKIGKSVNIDFREKTLAGQIPKIETILYFDNDIESILHQKYKEKRQRGEWFNLSADDILELIEQFNFKQRK
jgi:hypothetical protein